MIFWACPPNARLDPSAPTVCRRFDTFKESAIPYIKPYYDTYAEPHLARMQPYLFKGQEYYEQFGARAIAKGQDLWVKEASPRLKHGYSAFQYQYTHNVCPALDRRILQPSREIYARYLESHVKTISAQYTKHIRPYVHFIHRRGQKFVTERLIPAYHTAAPWVEYFIGTIEKTYATQVEPRVHAVIKWIVIKIEHDVIPRITLLWGVHVQPQLDRIYDKLFRNSDARQKEIEENKPTQR